jgi:hypothetical protein
LKTENLSTLKIHKLTQEQYDRELAAGRIDENAIYLTPDEEIDLSKYALASDVANKVNKVSGKGLSANDYTTTEKNKLAGIESGANKTTVDSSLSSTSTNPVQNKAVNTAISNLNNLVGDTKVSTQITNAISGVKLTLTSDGVLVLST